MNEDTLKGQWRQLRGRVRQQWGELTDDDVAQIKGSAEVLRGKIQERYGRSREQAEQDVAQWLENEGAVR